MLLERCFLSEMGKVINDINVERGITKKTKQDESWLCFVQVFGCIWGACGRGMCGPYSSGRVAEARTIFGRGDIEWR